MAIQHKSPEEDERTARAPYNFVTLPAEAAPGDEAASRSQDRFVGHSGRFECVLRTWSPLYIRGMMSAAEYREYGHKAFADLTEAQKDARAKFFADPARRPQIPGSSLRGMLRNIFEIVTHSKMSRVSARRLAFRSFGSDVLKTEYMKKVKQRVNGKERMAVLGGYLRRRGDEWHIQPAKEVGGTTFCRVKYGVLDSMKGEPIANTKNADWQYFEAGALQYYDDIRMQMSYATRVSAKAAPGLRRGAHVLTGTMSSKRSDAIIHEPDERIAQADWLPLEYQAHVLVAGKLVEIPVNVVDDYRAQISDEQIRLLGRDGALNDGQPIFYLLSDKDPVNGKRNVMIFGHSMMLRLVYPRSLIEMVPANLRSDELLDMTDALFGFVRQRAVKAKDGTVSNPARGGRLSFGPALLDESSKGAISREAITPKILGSPKPTTFQHYLAQDMPDDKNSLRTYLEEGAIVRGHKLYWHQNSVKVNVLRAPSGVSQTQTTQISPVNEGAQFRFMVTFENLTDIELGALAWVMQLAGSASGWRFKLGMGKPLGMGAVSVDATLVLQDRLKRYENLLDGAGWSTGEMDVEMTQATTEVVRKKFERSILDRPVLNPQKKIHLDELSRIHELLVMLTWPGPDVKDTRYMEIERDTGAWKKLNEYKNRPVLPAATDVWTPPVTAPVTPPETPPQPIWPPPPPRPPKPVDADIVTVTVLRIDPGAIVCKLPEETVVGKLPLAEWRSGPKPAAGAELRVRVLGKNQASEFKLTMKGVK